MVCNTLTIPTQAPPRPRPPSGHHEGPGGGAQKQNKHIYIYIYIYIPRGGPGICQLVLPMVSPIVSAHCICSVPNTIPNVLFFGQTHQMATCDRQQAIGNVHCIRQQAIISKRQRTIDNRPFGAFVPRKLCWEWSLGQNQNLGTEFGAGTNILSQELIQNIHVFTQEQFPTNISLLF